MVIPADNPNIGAPLHRTFFVDQGSVVPDETGTISEPFKTIQAALDTILPPVDLLDMQDPFTLLVVDGVYSEDLVIPANRSILIKSLSGFVTVSSVTWTQDILPFSDITILFLKELDVLGDVIVSVTNPVGFITGFLFIEGDIGGTIDVTGYPGDTLLLLFLENGSFGPIDAPFVAPFGGTILLDAQSCSFLGPVDIVGFGRVLDSNLEDDWITVLTGFFSTGPPGFIGCFYGPAGLQFDGDVDSFIVDATSNFWAKDAGVVLVPPATKFIASDTTP